jgi:hypothetical protein
MGCVGVSVSGTAKNGALAGMAAVNAARSLSSKLVRALLIAEVNSGKFEIDQTAYPA